MLVHEHTPRAEEHARQAVALDAAGSEWAAVAYFYAGYHRGRQAILSDPVFHDLVRLKAIDANLLTTDCNVTVHSGRRKPHLTFGLNDLVQLLYPTIWPKYSLLHQASIQVRYQSRLFIPMARVSEAYEAVAEAHEAGLLRA